MATTRSGMSDKSDTGVSTTSYWIDFFKNAGIPAGEAANHAVTFSDHRIQEDMLMDLNKEYLNDMGITMMGDIIAILKHAKKVHTQNARNKVLEEASPPGLGPTSVTCVVPVKRSTPASRMVDHYLRKDPETKAQLDMIEAAEAIEGPKISTSMAARLGPLSSPELGTPITRAVKKVAVSKVKLSKQLEERVPVPKVRRVLPEHEGGYKITMPQGSTAKTRKLLEQQADTSVFDRLGNDSPTLTASKAKGPQPTITVTGLGKIVVTKVTKHKETGPQGSSVFNRLGGKKAVKRAATSTVPDSDDDMDVEDEDQLEYAGILKGGSPSKKQKAERRSSLQNRLGGTVQDHASEGILGSETLKEGVGPKKRLGPMLVRAPASTTTITMAEQRVSPAVRKKSLEARLGKISPAAQKATSPATSSLGTGQLRSEAESPGVFSRLGKKH